NAVVAKAAGLKLGDNVGVLTLQPKKTFKLVGIFGYSGGRDSLGGAQEVAFTEPVAQELMLGEKGVYNAIDVNAASGVTQEQLRDRVAAAIGAEYQVQTRTELLAATAADIKEGLSFFNNVLIGFAAVAL